MRLPLRLLAGLLASALLMGACGSDADDGPDTTAVIEATVAETTVKPSETTAAVDTTSPTPSTPSTDTTTPVTPVAAEPIEVTATGLAGLSFGDDAETAISTLESIFGKPSSDTGWGEQQAPCDDMGSRSRAVTWGSATVVFATGPTAQVAAANDHMSAYFIYAPDVTDPIGPNVDRFVLSDGRSAIGRTLEELQAWSPDAKRFDSEIEGPIWVAGPDDGPRISGALATETDDGIPRSASVRAGLMCID